MQAWEKCGADLSIGASDCAACGAPVKHESPPPESEGVGFSLLFIFVLLPILLLLLSAGSIYGNIGEFLGLLLLPLGVWCVWYMLRASLRASGDESGKKQ
jgi:hypothetical protein